MLIVWLYVANTVILFVEVWYLAYFPEEIKMLCDVADFDTEY